MKKVEQLIVMFVLWSVDGHEVVDIPPSINDDIGINNVRLPKERAIKLRPAVDVSVLPDVLNIQVNNKPSVPVVLVDEARLQQVTSNIVDEVTRSDIDGDVVMSPGEESLELRPPAEPPPSDIINNVDITSNLQLTPIEEAALRSSRVHRSGNSYVCMNISVKKAVEKFGEVAVQAIQGELGQMLDKKVFIPVSKRIFLLKNIVR